MRKLIFVLLAVFLIVGVSLAEGKKYGKGVTLKEKTKISDIFANPEEFTGKKVLVEGMIVDVCSKRGCWMEIASDKEFEKIKIKVEDGEIVFPLEEKGKTALVEGTIEKIEMTKEQAIERAKHHAEEVGQKFDPASVTGPEVFYQIRGLGAVIK
ncbi:MAG: hypothetical protein AUK34_04895 [Ignavibacteria bacterium CG2_30_36_16]|nr:DUF4920 domain-containing protein [Ignavibacteria bacterium]OIP61497.1 MAG: hypothetical protein AUK34_04895 [Ignavibacteria bacterium CG2_30_36_16]